MTFDNGERHLSSLNGALDEYFSLNSMVLDYLDFCELSILKFFIIYKISLKLESPL